MRENSVLETRVETLLDDRAYAWSVGGDFSWGEGEALCPQAAYPLDPGLGPDGYRVLTLPEGLGEKARDSVAAYLRLRSEDLESYHRDVGEAGHAAVRDRYLDRHMADGMLGVFQGVIR